MNTPDNCIAKSGFVDHIDDHTIYVRINSVSACVSCQAKGVCNTSDSEEKLIEIDRVTAPELKPGQAVQVSMKTSSGNTAVFYGYLLPLILLVTALAVLVNYVTEGMAGLLSMAVLVPYYSVLYFVRERMKTKFRFTIN